MLVCVCGWVGGWVGGFMGPALTKLACVLQGSPHGTRREQGK